MAIAIPIRPHRFYRALAVLISFGFLTTYGISSFFWMMFGFQPAPSIYTVIAIAIVVVTVAVAKQSDKGRYYLVVSLSVVLATAVVIIPGSVQGLHLRQIWVAVGLAVMLYLLFAYYLKKLQQVKPLALGVAVILSAFMISLAHYVERFFGFEAVTLLEMKLPEWGVLIGFSIGCVWHLHEGLNRDYNGNNLFDTFVYVMGGLALVPLQRIGLLFGTSEEPTDTLATDALALAKHHKEGRFGAVIDEQGGRVLIVMQFNPFIATMLRFLGRVVNLRQVKIPVTADDSQ